MESNGRCPQGVENKVNIASLKEWVQACEDRIASHIGESDCKGGYRDRVVTLEQDVKHINKTSMFNVIVGGLIGGLLGHGFPEVVSLLIKLIS